MGCRGASGSREPRYIEAEGLRSIVDAHAGQCDLHVVLLSGVGLAIGAAYRADVARFGTSRRSLRRRRGRLRPTTTHATSPPSGRSRRPPASARTAGARAGPTTARRRPTGRPTRAPRHHRPATPRTRRRAGAADCSPRPTPTTALPCSSDSCAGAGGSSTRAGNGAGNAPGHAVGNVSTTNGRCGSRASPHGTHRTCSAGVRPPCTTAVATAS